MQAAVDVGVVVLVVTAQRFHYRPRLLGRRRIIEINQRLPVDLLAEDGEIFADRFPIYRVFAYLMHASMWGRPRAASLSSLHRSFRIVITKKMNDWLRYVK